MTSLLGGYDTKIYRTKPAEVDVPAKAGAKCIIIGPEKTKTAMYTVPAYQIYRSLLGCYGLKRYNAYSWGPQSPL